MNLQPAWVARTAWADTLLLFCKSHIMITITIFMMMTIVIFETMIFLIWCCVILLLLICFSRLRLLDVGFWCVPPECGCLHCYWLQFLLAGSTIAQFLISFLIQVYLAIWRTMVHTWYMVHTCTMLGQIARVYYTEQLGASSRICYWYFGTFCQ